MKRYSLLLALLAVILGFSSCSKDELNTESIFPNMPVQRNNFDTWLLNNYTKPYNVSFNYRYSDKDVSSYFNLVPADSTKAVALAIMMRHIWIEAYTELLGEKFMKENCPRIMQLVGSPQYKQDEELVLGTAEGGLKITLFNVNAIDIDHPFLECDNPFVDKKGPALDLNYWFFHTMHHEFCHILNQKKNYPTDFRLVSAAKYKTSDWVNVKDVDAPKDGFVSGYASSEYNEDFAEIYSTYVTHSEKAWQTILKKSITAKLDANGDTIFMKKQVKGPDGKTIEVREPELDTSGLEAILKKLDIMKNYYRDSWGLDMDKLREIVLRRSKEAVTKLDLRSLK